MTGDPSTDELVGRTLGEFVVRTRLGEGGFGAVYRAHQALLGREAVIKVLHTRLRRNEAAVQRFLREARLASRLDHPYAAHIYAFGVERDGLLWIAMELVDGVPLSTMLKDRGRFQAPEAVAFLERLCEVVHTAHSQGIVHRDLKPSNVMVLERAGRLLPKLLDLGIAKIAALPLETDDTIMAEVLEPRAEPTGSAPAAQDTLTVTPQPRERFFTEDGAILGSPPYMAPEQWASSADATERTDIYALGILGFEMLAGHRPFDGSTASELYLAHTELPPPSLGTELAHFDRVLGKALAKRPEDRFASALDLGEALRAAGGLALEPEPIARLAPAVRDAWIAGAPQPLAEAVAALDAARSAREARDALRDLTSVLAHYIGILALACRPLPEAGATDRSGELVRSLGQRRFADDDWRALTATLLRDATHAAIPELVEFVTREDSLSISLANLLRAKADRQIHELLAEAVMVLEQRLEKHAFVLRYPLGVVRDGRIELWMGVRRLRRASIDDGLDKAIIDERPRAAVGFANHAPVIVGPDHRVLFTLVPLVEVARPAPNAAEEMFFLEGRGSHGARFVAPPLGFERERDDIGDWFGDHVTPPERSAQADEVTAPYPGLSAFTTNDAPQFLGREREVEAFLNRLRVQAMIAVVGASGSGKSSFVQAGVIPRLPSGWRALTIRPGPTPLASLESLLRRLERPIVDLVQDPDAFGQAVRAAGELGPIVVIVDQFEELFTLCKDPAHQLAFADALARAVRTPDDPVRLVLTLRDDFLLAAEQLPPLRDRLAWGMQLLSTPDREALLRILVEPARRAGYGFDDAALPGETIDAIIGKPGSLALLAFAASELWAARDRSTRMLTRASYERMGGVGGALARHADSVVESMPHKDRQLVRQVFRQLVTAEGTRAVVTRDDLHKSLADDRVEMVIERLIEARLLVASEGPESEDQVEVVHETLLDAWPRLRDWLERDAAGARLRDQVRTAARQWQERGRPDGLLWRGDVLAEYERARVASPNPLGELEEAFVARSLAEARRGRRFRRTAFGGALVALSTAVAVLVYLRGEADHERAVASQARTKAEHLQDTAHEQYMNGLLEQGRRALLDDDPVVAAGLLARAHEEGVRGRDLGIMLAGAVAPMRAQRARFELGASVRRAEYDASGKRVVIVRDAQREVGVLELATGREVKLDCGDPEVTDARFSPAGDRVATAGKFPKVWILEGGTVVRKIALDHDGTATYEVRFSPDGKTLVTLTDAGVQAWDAVTGRLRWRQAAPSPTSVAIDPQARFVAAGGVGGELWIWGLGDGASVQRRHAHASGITNVAFSPEGDLIATSSFDRTAKLWRSATAGQLAVLSHENTVQRAVITRDHVVTVSEDGTAKVWNRAGNFIAMLAGHRASLTGIAIDASGKRSISVGRDAKACLHELPSGTLLECFVGHRSNINAAMFSPDGREVLTGSLDGTLRTWDASAQRFERSLTSDGSAQLAAVDEAGTRLVTFDSHGGLQMWRVDGRLQWSVAKAHDSAVTLHMTRAGDAVITTGSDGVAKLWDVEGHERVLGRLRGDTYTQGIVIGEMIILATASGSLELRPRARPDEVRVVRLHAGPIGKVVGWPDGTKLVTASDDGTAVILDIATGTRLQTLTGHTASVTDVDVAPDGATIATSALDRTIRIWSADGRTRHVLAGGGSVTAPRFDQTGKRLVSAHEDGSVRVWNAETGQPLAVLRGHRSIVFTVTTRGDFVASASSDGTAILWDLNRLGAIARFSGHSHIVFQAELVPTRGMLVTSSHDGTVKIWKVDDGGASLDDELQLAR